MSKFTKPKVVLPPNPYLIVREVDWTTGIMQAVHVIRFTAGVMVSRKATGKATYVVHAPGKPTMYAKSVEIASSTDAAMQALSQLTIAECR